MFSIRHCAARPLSTSDALTQWGAQVFTGMVSSAARRSGEVLEDWRLGMLLLLQHMDVVKTAIPWLTDLGRSNYMMLGLQMFTHPHINRLGCVVGATRRGSFGKRRTAWVCIAWAEFSAVRFKAMSTKNMCIFRLDLCSREVGSTHPTTNITSFWGVWPKI